jgi:hypothetical protein
MSEEVIGEKPVQTKKVKTKADKQAEHIARIKRTLLASLIGIGTGALSFSLGGIPDAAGFQKDGFLGFMLMLAGIVIQKHLFILMGMDTGKLGWKDWFYQGFMTFAFWFMTWAILLTSLTLAAGFSANITSAQAPMTVAFTDVSTGSPTNWSWDFGDGTTASLQNPVHLYTTSGVFNVSLTVSNTHGSNTKIVAGFISSNSTISH